MTKKDAVNALGSTADIMELLGENEFKVLAYRKAERILENMTGDWDAVVAFEFKKIFGIGAQLALALTEFTQSGRFGPLEDAASLVPPGVLELFRVRGLGPKKIRSLWNADVTSLEALIEGCRAGTIAAIKGFGAGTQAKLLENAEFVLTNSERRHMAVAEGAFEFLKAHLEGVVSRIEPGGSLRRGFETVGDLDVIVIGERDAVFKALEPFGAHDDPTYPWMIEATIAGMTVQLQVASTDSWGASQLMMTGSKPWLEAAKSLATKHGLEFSSRGLHHGETLESTPTEESAFALLEMPYIIPEWREPEHQALLDIGLETLPDPSKLIQLSQMRGMLHVHTSYSDGAHTLKQMALAAQALGMTYIGICDHSQTAAYAGGLTPARVKAQWQEIDAVQGEVEIRILKGIESDILADGSLDYTDDILEGFDFVVASIHSSFTLSEVAQTERLVRAVSNPFTTILGHPTGRLLLRRPPYKFDLEAVLAAAEAHGTVIEINANSYRLDLDWRDVLQARGRVQFAINTDAHHTDGFDDLKYGIRVARKAALETKDVINTLEVEEFLRLARGKRI
jgi:DNA polymerase (family X)